MTVRLPAYDYASPGAYFITVCTHQRACLLGEVAEGQMQANALGDVVQRVWHDISCHVSHVDVDALVVMPNHLHVILILDAIVGAKHPAVLDASPLQRPQRARGTSSGSIPAVVQNAKSVSARKINRLRGTRGVAVWQRGYYEHIIRTPDELDRLRAYVEQNPLRWDLDRETPGRV
jgi:putative transposase